MNINKLIKEAHGIAVDKGFYSDCYCNGCRKYQICDSEYKEPSGSCDVGISKNKNIGELIMLIVSELGEALEAHRKGRFAEWKTIDNHHKTFNPKCGITREISLMVRFESDIKDTFEDEIADVFIRLFDLCGYDNMDAYCLHLQRIIDRKIKDDRYKLCSKNIGSNLLKITEQITGLNQFGELSMTKIAGIFCLLINLCILNDINYDKHIKAKMEYNKTRPYKHGKEY